MRDVPGGTLRDVPGGASNNILVADSSGKLPTQALKVYDSGWFAVTRNDTYIKTHNLGTTKVLITIYVGDRSDGTGIVVPTMSELTLDGASNWNQTGVRELTPTTVVIRTGSSRIANVQDKDGNSWQPESGYARIIMLALE